MATTRKTTAKKAAAKKAAPKAVESSEVVDAKGAAATHRGAGRAVQTEILKVTPEMAGKWLEDNLVNRNIRPKVVAAYRRDMEEGRWHFTGEPLQRSVSGALLNGQHRLTALASADVKYVEMLVVSGLPESAQTLMDQGVARTISDALTINHGHIKNVTIVAGIARWMVVCDEVGPHFTPSSLRTKVSAAEAVAKFNEEPHLFERAGEESSTLRKYLLGSPTAMGYAWLQLFRVDPSACVEFFAGIRDMEWSMPNDPRKAALRRIHLMHGDEDVKMNIENAVMQVSVLTRAWNAWRKEEEMETINIRSRTGIILPVKPI
jgi:hypothetical protein